MSGLSGLPGASDSTSVGSGGDLESQLTPWLGPPNQFAPLNLDAEGKNPHTTHNLPLAYWGKSMAMEALIEFKITAKNEWYTSELMPFRKSEDISFTWMKFAYDKSFFEVEPYGGNPNYIQSSVEAYSDKMIQRGMAFTIAHQFWKTEMGKEQYNMNIEVLESSAQLTIYHLIIMALLKAKNNYRNWELRFKSPVTTIPQALKQMKLRWAIVNKGMHLFRQYSADLVEVMESNGVKPNIWGLPPKTKIIMSHTHESEYDYEKAGQLSQKVRKDGQSAYDVIRGIKVYETTVFNEVMFGQMYNPLRRVREYGSFFWITNYEQGSHLETYRNEDRFAAKILDASKDGQETKVSGKPLFRLSQRFAPDGSLSNYHSQLIRDDVREDLKRRLADSPQNNYIDMFIGYDPSRDTQNPYHVMEYLGEMWENDVQKHQLRHFAVTANNKLNTFSAQEFQAINDADRFMDDLNAVDFTNADHQLYWKALIASATLPRGENTPDLPTSELVKNNGDGCANPPILGDEVSIRVNNVETPLLFTNIGGREFVTTNENIASIAGGFADANAFRSQGLPALAPGTAGLNSVTGRNYLEKFRDATGSILRDDPLEQIFTRPLKGLSPLGYGHPTGLKTLANMSRKKDYRGYKQDLIDEAALHYNVIAKFHPIWKNIFPDHELGTSSACPYYFKSGNSKSDEITAFALNLYNHARYPVFAVIPSLQGVSLDFENAPLLPGQIEVEAKKGVLTGAPFRTLIDQGFGKIKTVTAQDKTRLDARLAVFFESLDSGEVKTALNESGTPKRLASNYRGKPYVKETKTLSVEEFLALIVTTDLSDATKDATAARILTGILEILLRDGFKDGVNWQAEINQASERPLRVRNFPAFQSGTVKPVTNEFNPRNRRMLNTRLCINPESFRNLAEIADSLGNANAVELKALFDFPIRPMNIFNPTQPLGYYKGQDVADDATTHKAALLEFRFASAPQGTNTVSSLTTSPVLSNHLGQLALSQASAKRGSDDLFSTASAAPKRRLIGGVLMSQDTEADSATQTQRLFGGVPVSSTTYLSSQTTPYFVSNDPDSHGTVPANIALSEAFRVFTHDSLHQDIAGGAFRTRHFRSSLVSKFHDWAFESNVCERIWAQSWITSKIKLQTFDAFWMQDVIPLVSFELWRTRQRYYMGSGFLAEGGPKLGNAFHGFHDFQWTDDIIRKVHVGHYTFLFACPVKEAKQFALCEDIVAMGHIDGGENVSFIQGPDDFNLLCTDPDNAPGCILVKMVPYNRELPASPQDVSGRWNQSVIAQCNTDGLTDVNQIHGQSAYFYSYIFKLDKLNVNLVQREPIFHSPTTSMNTVGWRGHHRIYSPVTGNWNTIILDDGPFGENVYKGVISDRSVTGRPIKDMDFSKNCQIYS